MTEFLEAEWDIVNGDLVRIINPKQVKTNEAFILLSQVEWLKYKKYAEVVRPILNRKSKEQGYFFEREDGEPQVKTIMLLFEKAV